MTRKDYELIAGVIERYVDAALDENDDRVLGTLQAMVSDLSMELKRDNSQFKTGVFIDACGL